MQKHDVFKYKIENVEIEAVVVDIVATYHNYIGEFEIVYLCYGQNILFTLTECEGICIDHKVIAESVTITEIDNGVKLYNLI